MVSIKYQPIKEIVVHELVKVNSVEEFLSMRTANIPLGGAANPARWVDGILYEASGYPPTPEVIKDQLQDILHLAAIEYTEMKEYKPFLQNKANNVILPIINMSHNLVTKEVGKWLRNQLTSE